MKHNSFVFLTHIHVLSFAEGALGQHALDLVSQCYQKCEILK
jgi:hypothetical protein